PRYSRQRVLQLTWQLAQTPHHCGSIKHLSHIASHQEQQGMLATLALGAEANPIHPTSAIRIKSLRMSLIISSSLPFLSLTFRQPPNIEDTPCPNSIFS